MAHPGQLLRDDLGELGTSKTELARRLGITRKMLYDILNGTSAVTAPMALKLEAVVGSSAEFWLGMQMQHDLWKARQAAKPRRAVKAAKRAKAA
jgi:addiction module HigA family antidote